MENDREEEQNSISNQPKETNSDVRLFMELIDMGFNRSAVAEAINLKLEKEAAVDFILSLGDLSNLDSEENELMNREENDLLRKIGSIQISLDQIGRRQMIMQKLNALNDDLIDIVLKYLSCFDANQCLSMRSIPPKLEKRLRKLGYSRFNQRFVEYCVGYCTQEQGTNTGYCKGYINEMFVSNDNFVHVVKEPLEPLNNFRSTLELDNRTKIEQVHNSNGQALLRASNSVYNFNYERKSWSKIKEQSKIISSRSADWIINGKSPITILDDCIVYFSLSYSYIIFRFLGYDGYDPGYDSTQIKEFPLSSEIRRYYYSWNYSIIDTRKQSEENKKFVVVKCNDSNIKVFEGTLTSDCIDLSWKCFPDFMSSDFSKEHKVYRWLKNSYSTRLQNSGFKVSELSEGFSSRKLIFNLGFNLYVMEYVELNETCRISGKKKFDKKLSRI